ncbi:MAG: putative acetyltransferase EpsM [Bacteroidota bacterium]|jgi:acetyltransferase EpsM
MLPIPAQLNRLMETNLILFGASGHGKVVVDILHCLGIEVTQICDDNPKIAKIQGVTVVPTTEVDFTSATLLFTIGNNRVRAKLANRFTNSFITAVHPKAVLAKSVQMDTGTVVMAGAVINTEARIGKHVIINTGALIDHECIVEDFVHISPGVALAGNVTIGEGTHVGIGACVIQGVKIGKWCTIGAGAVIIKDIPDYAVVVGNPGKIIKYNQPHEFI